MTWTDGILHAGLRQDAGICTGFPSPLPGWTVIWRGVPGEQVDWHVSLGSFEQLSEASLSLLPESLFLPLAALG